VSGAIGYIRASTGDQAIGIEAQRQQIVAYCERVGLSLAGIFTDEGVSGGTPLENRDGLTKAIAGLNKHTSLVVAKLDRLGRDSFEVLVIERAVQNRSSRVVSVAGEGTDGEGPEKDLMRALIVAVAQYERAIIRSRIKGALAAKKANNERIGAIPYGKRLADDGKTLEYDPGEMNAIRHAKALRGGEHTDSKTGKRLSYGKISKILAELGMLSRSGKPFHSQQIKRMCEN
jgi:DNA invertase Pin-like site-specific DNA recombinase